MKKRKLMKTNLFEKSYVNFQKHANKIDSLSVILPTFYQKYRKEQLSKILEETECSKDESRVKPNI